MNYKKKTVIIFSVFFSIYGEGFAYIDFLECT